MRIFRLQVMASNRRFETNMEGSILLLPVMVMNRSLFVKEGIKARIV